MTDEQLRATIRIIAGAFGLVRTGNEYAGDEKWRCNGTEDVLLNADDVEAAAVAILREAMELDAIANKLPSFERFAAIAVSADDPTQSLSIDVNELVLPKNIAMLPPGAW